VATPYADVLARNVRAARARARIGQAEVAAVMSKMGFGAWVRQTVTKVERGERRLTAEEVLGLSIALRTTIAALMMPQNEDNGIMLPSGYILPGSSVQASVSGYSPAAWPKDDEPGGLLPSLAHAFPGAEDGLLSRPIHPALVERLRGEQPDVSDATES
jgi:transcriptional regulator with XRE-family HTH domain